MSIARAVINNAAAALLVRVFTALMPILLVPLMIGAWGLEKYGEWLILTAIPTYLMIAPDFGLGGAVVSQMAISAQNGDASHAIKIYRSAWVALTALGLSLVGIAFFVTRAFSWGIVNVSELRLQAPLIVSLFALQILIGQQTALVSGVYKSAQKNARYTLLTAIISGASLVVSLVALVGKLDPVSYATVLTAARLVSLPLVLAHSRRVDARFHLSITGVDIRVLRPYVVPGIGHAGLPLVNALQNQGVLLVVGVALGPGVVAVFNTVRVLSNGVRAVLAIPSAAVGAEISALIGAGQRNTIDRLLVRNTQLTIAIAVCAVLAVPIVGDVAYRTWLPGAPPLPLGAAMILMASQVPCAIGASFTVLLLAANEIHVAVSRLVPLAVLSLGLVWIGTIYAGLYGATWGILMFEVLTAMLMAAVASRQTWLNLSQFARSTLDLPRSFVELKESRFMTLRKWVADAARERS